MMNKIRRLTVLLILVAPIIVGHPTADNSGDGQLDGSKDDHLKETLTINALNIKKLKANVSSLWAEMNEIKIWTQQHEKGVHHNYESYGYHGHDYGNHAPDGHQSYYGGHYSPWHPIMYPPRVWYHIHDVVSGRSQNLLMHSNNHLLHSFRKKKSDDSSEEEEEEEEEEKKKSEKKNKKEEEEEEEVEEEEKVEEEEGEKKKKSEGKEKNKEKEEEEVEEEEKVEEKAKKVEEEEVKKKKTVEEVKKAEEEMEGEVKDDGKKAEVEKSVQDEKVEDNTGREEEIKVEKDEEEKKGMEEEEEEEEEDEVKPRSRSLFGHKKMGKHGRKPGFSTKYDRKGNKNTIFHNIRGSSKSKHHPKNEAKKQDENEIISKAFCDLAPNVEIPESEVIGNVTIFQKRNSKGPLYFHVNLQVNLIFVGMDEAGRPHGFHIHVNPLSTIGHCNSTGPHFNPTGQAHGSLHSDIRHLGDFGNIVVDKNGKLDQYIFVDSTNTLEGENSIISRSIDIHEKPDDLGKGGVEGSLISGNSGRKLACCTIHSLADALAKLKTKLEA